MAKAAGDWQLTNDILLKALELEPEQWPGFLNQACGENEELRIEVESLLHVDPDSLGVLDRPAFSWYDRGSGAEPRQIGPYRLIDKLGSGGVATVYLGVRADAQDQRPVAIKLLSRELCNEELLRRFQTEGEILSQMHHPSIAEFVGMGTLEDDRPYLVMEYVQGEPIDRYCAQRGLSLEGCLGLVMKVCGAVQFAHQNLVVHRDLKPSNIFITDDGEPKLLDFGIAKLLNGSGLKAPAETVPGFTMWTPGYASPEQIEGGPVTTATDVYSLGVVLYELLSGSLPFEVGTNLRLDQIRAMLEREATPPSLAARQTGHGDTQKLVRRLQGDLDNIVLTALRRLPASRYPSPEHLAADLRRHLNGFPVRARRPTLTYRLGKVIRRRKRELALLLLLLISLGSVAVSRELHQRQVLEEKNRAQQVTQLLVELFEGLDPASGTAAEMTAGELLDLGAERINQLDGQPELKAAFLNTLGRVNRSLGRYDTAQALLQQGLDLRQEIHKEQHPAVVESLSEYGKLLFDRSDYDGAERQFRRALELQRQLHDDDEPGPTTTLSLLAGSIKAQGRYDTAEALYRQVLERQEQQSPVEAARTLSDVCVLHLVQGEASTSRAFCEEALTLRRQALGPTHPDVAESLRLLGQAVAGSGDPQTAAGFYDQAVDIERQRYPQGHPRLATTLTVSGLTAARLGHYERAAELLGDAFEMRRRLLGERHPETAKATTNVAMALWLRGAYAEAEGKYRQALELHEELAGREDSVTSVILVNLGHALVDQGDFAGAEPLMREALEIQRRVLGEEHPWVAYSLLALGQLYHEKGAHEEAEAHFIEALGFPREEFDANRLFKATASISYARLLVATGNPGRAEAMALEAVEIFRHNFRPDHPRVLAAESVYGSALSALGRAAAAEPLLTSSTRELTRQLGSRHRRAQRAAARAVHHFESLGRPAEAAEYRALEEGNPR